MRRAVVGMRRILFTDLALLLSMQCPKQYAERKWQ